MLSTKFGVNRPFGLGEEVKNRFSTLQYLGFLMRMISPMLTTPMLPTKFQDNWPFVSKEEGKNRFSRGLPWQPSWISHQNNFNYFISTSHPTKFHVIWPFVSGEEGKNGFSRLWPSWISDQNNFFIYKSPCCFLPSLESISLSVLRRRSKK